MGSASFNGSGTLPCQLSGGHSEACLGVAPREPGSPAGLALPEQELRSLLSLSVLSVQPPSGTGGQDSWPGLQPLPLGRWFPPPNSGVAHGVPHMSPLHWRGLGNASGQRCGQAWAGTCCSSSHSCAPCRFTVSAASHPPLWDKARATCPRTAPVTHFILCSATRASCPSAPP